VLLLFLATLVRVLNSRLGMADLYRFVLPSAAVVGLILGERGVLGVGGRMASTNST